MEISRETKTGVLAALTAALAGVTMWATERPTPKPAPAAAPQPAQSRPCILSGSDTVFLFEALAGAREFTDATYRKDHEGMQLALRANRYTPVAAGSRCNRIERAGGDWGEFEFTRVRITDGPLVGVSGWARVGQTEPR